MKSDSRAERFADERARSIRHEEIALFGDVMDVDVETPILGVVAERGVGDEIRGNRVRVRAAGS